ncbi:MAG: transposase [Bacteroidota bacterium]
MYWLFPKIEDWGVFVLRVALVCQFILDSVLRKYPNRHVISIDEKTGIQAIERAKGTAPKSKGAYQRVEYEYIRNGTTTLIAANNVENGQVINYHMGDTRNETDYADFVKSTVNALPEMDQVVILSDQLNTHVSQTLVRWIAECEGYNEDLGIKGRKGILKNMVTRRNFLEKEEHRIRFVFTPKHCSWLNPIENWFAKLQRHVISKGNFSSVQELQTKVEAYIAFYNKYLAKPLRWKFKGFDKDRKPLK